MTSSGNSLPEKIRQKGYLVFHEVVLHLYAKPLPADVKYAVNYGFLLTIFGWS